MIKTLLASALALSLGVASFTLLAPVPVQSQEAANDEETDADTVDAVNPNADKPLLHPLFSENAVLQRDRPLTMWGWTAPGQSVAVTFDGTSKTFVADNSGRWSAPIAAHAAGGPHSLEVAANGQSETRKNLLFGDVWLCSGQSNMGFSVNRTENAAAKAEAANYPDIRLLFVPHTIEETPIATIKSSWKICSPEAVGNFSAVGYFFGRKLNEELKVPIGLLDASWGGSVAEAWVSAEGLEKAGGFDEFTSAIRDQTLGAKRYAKDPGTKENWQNADVSDADWTKMEVPVNTQFDGVMWFRREVNVPAKWAGRDLRLNLGAVDDEDTTFWNGALVGKNESYKDQRLYHVPGARVKAGRNLIAVRVLNTGGGGGITGPAPSLDLVGDSKADSLALSGAWKARPGAPLADIPAARKQRLSERKNVPTVLYNGMIAPLLPGQIKGAIWYQGESNASRAAQYRTLLPALMRDWRAQFDGPLPFYIVQLPNYRNADKTPSDDSWPRLREAQLLASRQLPDAGLAVTIDVGEARNLHSKDKTQVGVRLALQALRHTYGQNIEASGPVLQSAKAEQGALILRFDHAQNLNLKGEANRVFAIAGADGKFSWATPTIAEDTVTLRASEVSAPKFARFGWSNNPRATLYNAAGLPASPFRTDGDGAPANQ